MSDTKKKKRKMKNEVGRVGLRRSGGPSRVTALNWEVSAGGSLRRRHWSQDAGAGGLTHAVT